MNESQVTAREARPARRLLLSAGAVVILSCALAAGVQTSWGRVKVHGLTIPTQNGQWLAADLFRPRSATSDTPAPLVVVVPGFQRSKEALAAISIELARRGVVVIAIDPYAQGASSSSASNQAATTEGYGMFAVIDYAANTGNLNYVDKARIGATGHSAGGNAAIRGAAYFGRRAAKSGKPSVLNAVFVSGYVLTFTDNVLKNVRSNVGTAYARYDEGAYRNELRNGDMRRAPEALRLVNSGPGSGNPGRRRGGARPLLWRCRVAHAPRGLQRACHPPASSRTWSRRRPIRLEYFDRVFGLQSDLSPRDQIWYWKELLGVVAIMAALVGLVPLAGLLLRLPVFSPLVHPLPPALPRPRNSGRVVFWTVFVFGAVVACLTYIPMSELSQRLFVAASNREPTWFFPQRMNNAVLLWAVLNGLVGFLLFFLTYRFHGRHRGVRTEMWGARHRAFRAGAHAGTGRRPLHRATTACCSRSITSSTWTTAFSSWASAPSSLTCCCCSACTRRSSWCFFSRTRCG